MNRLLISLGGRVVHNRLDVWNDGPFCRAAHFIRKTLEFPEQAMVKLGIPLGVTERGVEASGPGLELAMALSMGRGVEAGLLCCGSH